MRRNVGAVIVKDNHILSTGYNGSPKGIRHCDIVGCVREEEGIAHGKRHELCRGLHAEQNALIQAAVFGVPVKGGKMYITHFPCSVCSKMIINGEISEIIYDEYYPDKLSMDILEESNIKVRKLDE
jgi:dCMP deaminase